MQCTCLHCTALHCATLHSTAMHWTTLHSTALHCTSLHCTALHYIAMLSSASGSADSGKAHCFSGGFSIKSWREREAGGCPLDISLFSADDTILVLYCTLHYWAYIVLYNMGKYTVLCYIGLILYCTILVVYCTLQYWSCSQLYSTILVLCYKI